MGIRGLVEKDMIYRVKQEDTKTPDIQKGEYRVLDPLLGYMLRRYS